MLLQATDSRIGPPDQPLLGLCRRPTFSLWHHQEIEREMGDEPVVNGRRQMMSEPWLGSKGSTVRRAGRPCRTRPGHGTGMPKSRLEQVGCRAALSPLLIGRKVRTQVVEYVRIRAAEKLRIIFRHIVVRKMPSTPH